MAGDASQRLILASASATRRDMLQKAGLKFAVVPADVDEAAIRASLARTNTNPEGVALTLAAEKAKSVSAQNPGALVIGSDQILALEGEIINKVASREAARAKLQRLRGRTHSLHSAAALACGGAVTWSAIDTATLTMRRFDDITLDTYLDAAGGDILDAVGCYHIEGLGVGLFEEVHGSHFTILGLPLLALLAELRSMGVIP